MRALAQRAVVLFVLGISTLGSAVAPTLQITSRSFSADAILTLDIAFNASSEITVYSWRGHIYPLLGFGLEVAAHDPHGHPLAVESVAKFVPKLPDARDVETASTYTYPEPLVVQLLDDQSRPLRGCAEIQVTYDLTSDRSGNFERNGVSLIRVRSNTIRVCNAEE